MAADALFRRPGPARSAAVFVVLALALGGCRRGAPVIDMTPKNPNAEGTISGMVRGPEGTSPMSGRTVEVVNVETGEKQQTTTSSTGGFTFKVKPGRYRLTLALQDGESIVKQPGVIQINSSDVDSNRDIVIGSARGIARPRFAAPAQDSGLAPPIA